MTKLSRIAFHFGTVLLLLTGLAHLAGHFSGPPSGLSAEQQAAFEKASTVQFAMPTGEMRTLIDIQNAFSLYFAIFTIALAIVLWLSVRKLEDPRPVLLVVAVATAVAAGVTIIYAILPPFVMLALSAAAFLTAALAPKSVR